MSLATTTTNARLSAAWSPEEKEIEISSLTLVRIRWKTNTMTKRTSLETRSASKKGPVMSMMSDTLFGNSFLVSSWVASSSPSLSKAGSLERRLQVQKHKLARALLLSKWDSYQTWAPMVNNSKLPSNKQQRLFSHKQIPDKLNNSSRINKTMLMFTKWMLEN